MEQIRAINALAPFLALSKSATSPRAASDLVMQATSAQNTYVFAELLQTPAMQNLRQDEQNASYYKLLELFSWGTWQGYQASASSLPPLSDVQAHKLRLLTLLTLAAQCTSTSQLTYSNLQSALSLSSPRELENLVTDAIYADLLSGTLNPAQQIVVITSVAPLRDLAPGSVGAMVAELEAWSQRCDGVLQDLEAEIARVKSDAGRRARREQETAAQIERAEEKFTGSGAGQGQQGYGDGHEGRGGARLAKSKGMLGMMGLRGPGTEEDPMDVDGGGGGLTGRKGKSSSGFGRKR